MTLVQNLKYRDILVSLIGNKVTSITFKINGELVDARIVDLLKDLVMSSDKYDSTGLKSKGLYKKYMKALSRLVSETNGRPYGYRCDREYLLNDRHGYFSFITFGGELNFTVSSLISMCNESGMYISRAGYGNIIRWCIINDYSDNVSCAVEGALAHIRKYNGVAYGAVGKAATVAAEHLRYNAIKVQKALDNAVQRTPYIANKNDGVAYSWKDKYLANVCYGASGMMDTLFKDKETLSSSEGDNDE